MTKAHTGRTLISGMSCFFANSSNLLGSRAATACTITSNATWLELLGPCHCSLSTLDCRTMQAAYIASFPSAAHSRRICGPYNPEVGSILWFPNLRWIEGPPDTDDVCQGHIVLYSNLMPFSSLEQKASMRDLAHLSAFKCGTTWNAEVMGNCWARWWLWCENNEGCSRSE